MRAPRLRLPSFAPRRGLVALLMLAALLLSACASAQALGGPPNINFGRDVCERCGMIIEDARFASGYVLDDGTQHVFDDIGGMLAWADLAGDLRSVSMWVHDYDTEEWIEAAGATYVFSSELMTPMAFGIAAFATPEAAAAFAEARAATVATWDEVLASAEAGRIGHEYLPNSDGAGTGEDSLPSGSGQEES